MECRHQRIRQSEKFGPRIADIVVTLPGCAARISGSVRFRTKEEVVCNANDDADYFTRCVKITNKQTTLLQARRVQLKLHSRSSKKCFGTSRPGSFESILHLPSGFHPYMVCDFNEKC